MAHKEIPIFYGTNYLFWSKRMKSYLMSLGFDVWDNVFNGYKIPKNPPIYLIERKVGEYNAKDVNAILGGMSKPEFVKVMNFDTTK